MKTIRIGLLGTDFCSGNFGCAALGYGFIRIIDAVMQISGAKATVTVFDRVDIEMVSRMINLKSVILQKSILEGNRTREQRKRQQEIFKRQDVIFDFTAGDSFSDIYGLKRFVSRSLVKMNVIKTNVPLILGNQTYGPFNSMISKIIAGYIIRNAYCTFSRDEISEKYVWQMFKYNMKKSLDVAFALPYKKNTVESDKIKLGINVSGLLWSGGYTKNNQFKLKFSYRDYCISIIKQLIETQKYDIYLIPHVISDDMTYPDNDLIACEELKELFPDLMNSPRFNNPIEAKSFIAAMDIVIGARMHATIAAFSSGVPVIPFAYSRKFAGLFGDFDYEYVIDGCAMEYDNAISCTMKYINEQETLKNKVSDADKIIKEKLSIYQKDLTRLLVR